MKRSRLTTRILMEIEKLIAHSLNKMGEPLEGYLEFHAALLKKYYNAASVEIDHNRHRIKMDVIVDDMEYDPKEVNTILTTMPANIFYDNLNDFLHSCLETDIKSLAFYAKLIMHYTHKNVAVAV